MDGARSARAALTVAAAAVDLDCLPPPDALTLRGSLLLRAGKRDEAVAQFDEALKLDPTNEEARKNREQALGK